MHSMYIRTVSFSFGTFDSFLAGFGRNLVYSACCSAQMAQKQWFKPVKQSRQQALRVYCPNLYCEKNVKEGDSMWEGEKIA